MLKSIEIQGFKSFPDKTVLDFPTGITAVVGPNGSGKSNIVDAIRWVLGEQSSKNIRITGSVEVIFSGTSSRQASSLASVSLCFDNTQGVFPSEYSEILLTRKVYRDGNSEYFINKKQVRLKDLIQLLAGARLGVKGMSIINQGAADIFLRANPIERREMIEEMVGLKEYRIKKGEAERKIREARDNLLKIQTLVSEMEPNLHSLKRQVSRWQSRAAKETELKSCEEKYFVQKLYELEHLFEAESVSLKEPGPLRLKQASIEKVIHELTDQINALEAPDPKLVSQKETLSREVHSLRDQKTGLSRRLGNLEGQLEALKRTQEKQELVSLASLRPPLETTIRHLEEAQSKSELSLVHSLIQKALESLKNVLQAGRQEIEGGADQQELAAAYGRDAKELERIAKILREREEELQQIQTNVSHQSEELRQAYKLLESKRIELRECEVQLEELRFAEEKKKMKEEDLRLKLQEADWDYETVKKRYEDCTAAGGFLPLAGDEWRELEMKTIRLRRDLGAIGEIDESIVKEYEEINGRHSFLETQEKDITAALGDWETLNQSLEEKITSGFNTALLKIDKEFNRYFSLVFEGGKASLRVERIQTPLPIALEGEGPIEELQEEVLPLEVGVEFSVHLPRKKIRSLEMLSGGEKTLTAVALLFAITSYARPPFLVLDEIDATLDERNSAKVAKLLQDLAHQVQFVLITHNRSVMEAAKVLYGITMDDGISRVFSLRFAEAKEMAKQDVHNNQQLTTNN